MSRRLVAIGGSLLLAFGGGLGLSAPAAAAPAPSRILYAAGPNAVAGRYIVVLKDTASLSTATSVATKAQALAAKFSGRTRHIYTDVLHGFSVAMTAAKAEQLAADPSVAYVEQVQRMSIADTQNNPPNWGDDRIDQRNLPLNSSFTYPANPGQGVTVYILDTGLNASHVEFTGRVKQGTDIVDGDSTPQDCHGHGTHVAGTAVGTTYGIAKKASLVSVRVLNCQGSGFDDDFIAGFNWVRTNAQKPAVANYSIGCTSRCTSQALESAVSSLISSGVQFVQAAGNAGDDACFYSPQRLGAAITVGNSTSSDARNSTSNYGSCLDIFAPGTSIVSASYSSNTGSATMTGTSMASPHVTGSVALYLGQNPNATPADVRNALVTNGTTGKITSPGSGSPNVLLYTGFIGGGTTNPSVTNPGNQSTAVGQSADLQLQASGGTAPYTWSASGLPAGLSLNSSTGRITGTATTAGTSNVTVTVTDSASKTGSAQFTWTVTTGGGCSATQVVGNSGFESGTTPWTANTNVIGNWTAYYPAHGGTRSAWLGGQGRTHTDYAQQTVTIPAGCSAVTLRFWLLVDTDETESLVYDKMTVTLGSTTVATYSNLNPSASYVERTFDASRYAGQTVTLKFNGVEDSNLQTSWLVDDVTITAS